MVLKLFIVLVIAVFAFWLSALCGGGASMVLIPLLQIMMPISLVPFSMTAGAIASSASRMAAFKRFIRWDVCMVFIPASIPAVILGASFLKYVNPFYLQFIVGLLLFANIPELFRRNAKETPLPTNTSKFTLAIIGFLAGFISGITGAIGLLFNRFYLKYGLSKEEIIATRAANEISIHAIKLILYFSLGLFSNLSIVFGLIIAIASVLSSYSLRSILPKISETNFRKIGYAAMVVSGFYLLAVSATTIIREDRISLSTNKYHEPVLNWRKTTFALEFTIDEGLEVERPVNLDELPKTLQAKYQNLIPSFDTIQIEKVYRLAKPDMYEFYCFKSNELFKYEYAE